MSFLENSQNAKKIFNMNSAQTIKKKEFKEKLNNNGVKIYFIVLPF